MAGRTNVPGVNIMPTVNAPVAAPWFRVACAFGDYSKDLSACPHMFDHHKAGT